MLSWECLIAIVSFHVALGSRSVAQSAPITTVPLLLPPAALPWAWINATIFNVTNHFIEEFAKNHSYCILDGKKDQESAFPSDQTPVLSECRFEGDPSLKLCTKAEVQIYLAAIIEFQPVSSPVNCNLTSWPRGCEPGWCSSIQIGEQEKIYLDRDHYVPNRNVDPQPCCPGFFCPRGLSCMIPCPLGAYCPPSTFNPSWQGCDPYNYQPTPNTPGSYCGGANVWGRAEYTWQVFCGPGFYCPNATSKLPCMNGHYCRMGSSKPKKCLPFVPCGPQSFEQNIQLYGYMLITVLAAMVMVLYGCSDQLMIIQQKSRARAREKAKRSTTVISSGWNLTRRLSSSFGRRKSNSHEEMQVLVPSTSQSEAQHSTENGQSSSANTNTSPTPSRPRTRSQIFSYAYNQLERERLHSLDIQCRPRPRIEISFEDLTLTLRKNREKILCNVTGKLLPGHIAAVMGPSGAGKTTFLNAVAGKATGSSITSGRVLINGKHVPIQAFKKIIGFVPQDDIVHGLLTVEENLYFSAKYRLPSSLPKPEVVLIIERTLNSLGLDAIRNSLVGTVETRGISGGQRKRVNVGLEMVIEPALLILDEPTSGLDSTSSRLVLEALRREASMGVNVVVVLHQPNYRLFRMFDDVMLLTKGGHVAYHGTVENVENYFTGLGFPVPERVSLPDHLMDVLEGTVTSESNHSSHQAMLPVIWMQRLGYPIPSELQAQASLQGEPSSSPHETTQTLSQEAWEEVKDPMVTFVEGVRTSFPTTVDLSARKTPGFRKQYWIILERIWKQRFQETRLVAQDYLVLLMAGIGMGLLSDVKDINLDATAYTFTIIAISLLGMVASLRTFSLDKLHFWRESASGINRVAYFLAKDTLDHMNTLFKPLVYLSMFYFLIDSRSTFVSNYVVTVALLYCVTGLGYMFAIILQPSTAQLISVLLPVVETLVASKRRDTTTGFMAFLIDMTFARWAFEAYIVSNAERYDGVWLITRCGVLQKFGYRLDHKYLCVFLLFFHGLAARAISLGCLLFCNRSRQR